MVWNLHSLLYMPVTWCGIFIAYCTSRWHGVKSLYLIVHACAMVWNLYSLLYMPVTWCGIFFQLIVHACDMVWNLHSLLYMPLTWCGIFIAYCTCM